MTYGIALTSATDGVLRRHLIRADGQEDVCYGLWYPSRGANRTSALVHEVVLPGDGERFVHGNASVTGTYLSRVTSLAREREAGIVFLHSHPSPGWQDMSEDDIRTERRQAGSVFAGTGLPLVGMTLGNNGDWSGRFWNKTAPRTFERAWCESVRVVGDQGLTTTFSDRLLPPPAFREELKRTISAWGTAGQQKLARLTIGVVGLGSVGSIIAESLARIGIQHIKLIDFDRVELHNLDRLLNATHRDARKRRLKVDVAGDSLALHATAASPVIDRLAYAVTEEDGFREALDCDILFSCVDRPWPRHVLNFIAYAHLIPVIDGGILIRTTNDRLRHASWRMHSILPGNRCLACLGQYDPSWVNVERRGDLDDPRYINSLPDDHPLRRNENVFPFSSHLASSLMVHMLHVALNPVGIADLGAQIYHFTNGTLETDPMHKCDENCSFPPLTGMGDRLGLVVTGKDHGAARAKSAAPRKWYRRIPWL